MTPDQTSQLETLVSAIRDVDARFEPALAAQKEANETVDALTLEQEAAREAYETFMWQLKDDPDLLNPAVAAEPETSSSYGFVMRGGVQVKDEPTPEPTVAEQNPTPTV